MENTKDLELKQFTNTLFALKGLTSDIQKEKETLLLATGQIVNAGKEIQENCKKFKEQIEKSKDQVEYVIAIEMRKISKAIVEEVTQEMVEALTSRSEETIKRLEGAGKAFEETLRSSGRSISKLSMWFLIATFTISLVAGLAGGIAVHYLFPKMDKEVITRLNKSVTFSDFKHMVDEKEKQKK